MGTGFVIAESGWIVTNLHVIAGSPEVTVTLPDETKLPVVEVINASPEHDLVVLRIEARGLPVLQLGDSEVVRPGDPVVAIGHPLGLDHTVSNGLVSAVREADDLVVLQISAPIAPGSSGGPLFNERGEVIGVATAILRGGQNLNLGLPVRYVKDLASNPSPLPFDAFNAMMRAEMQADSRPRIVREIPEHNLDIFSGCTATDLENVALGIASAIAAGAPLYNQGNIAACYHIYAGAASDMERLLPAVCPGPSRALAAGRERASKLEDVDAQAWAMRDAFDGLMNAIERKLAPELQ